jgi:hypothetical protein
MRCPVKIACEYVVEERLRVTVEIDEAYREWKRVGGRQGTWGKERNQAQHRYADLLRLLTTTVQFANDNDRIAIAHYEAILRARREKDRERQLRNRMKARLERARAGDFDKEVLAVLDLQRIWRQIQHAQAKKHPDCPSQLKRTPPDASVFDAQVWLGQTRLKLRRAPSNDYSIAKEMQSLGWELHRTTNALRDRVRRSLTRVALLERLKLHGLSDPVWPRFGHLELRDALDFEPLRAISPEPA